MHEPLVGNWLTEGMMPSFLGSEIGPPRELTAVKTADTFIQLAWLPPHPETSPIIAYRLKYGPSSDKSRSQEMLLQVE